MSKMEGTLVILVLLFAVSNAAKLGAVDPELAELKTSTDRVDNQYIVVLKDSADLPTAVGEVESMKGVAKILQKYKSVIKGFSVRLTSKTAPAVLTLIRQLKAVAYVEEDGNVEINEAAMAWGLDRIDQRKLPLDGQDSFTGTGGNGVNVYIIDTGIYPGHHYFSGRAAIAYDSVGDGYDGLDCNGHGTHCAGTIGADYYGIARNASLFGIRVLNCYGSGYWSGVVAGMDWVAENHPRNQPAVASMSLGGGKSDTINKAVENLYKSGVPVSVAAGNSDYDACLYSPASAPNAITVGATDYKDYRAYFSNYGFCLDIFAPGVDVLSTVIGDPYATAEYSGTSMACPHVTGAIAIALGNDKTLTPDQVWDKLEADSTSNVLQDKEVGSPDRMLYVPCNNCQK